MGVSSPDSYRDERDHLNAKQKMNRHGKLYEQIISLENLQLADEKARKGKRHVVFTGSAFLLSMIKQVPTDKFPFTTKIVKQEDGSFQFT